MSSVRFLLTSTLFSFCWLLCVAIDRGDGSGKPSSDPARAKPVSSLKLNVLGVDLAEQGSIVVKAVPSTVLLLALNHVLKMIKNEFKFSSMPHALVGMFAVLVALVSMKDEHAEKIVAFMKPGVDLLTAFLPAFFIPALIVSPLSLSSMSGIDSLKFFGATSLGIPFIYLTTGRVVEFLQKLQGSSTPRQEQAPVGNQKFVPPFSAALEKLMTAAVVGSGALALFRPGKPTHVFYAITTIYSYVFSTRIPRVMHPTLRRFLHPLLLSFAWSTVVLGTFAALRGQSLFPVLREYLVPGGPPTSAAGNHVLFWLEPCIITFAFGLHERRRLLFDNALPILAGAATSTVGGIFSMALLGRVLGAPTLVRMALLPRATAALAMVQAGIIGANAPLTAVNCCYMGIFGANFGIFLLNGFRILDPIARGVATGGSALALAAAALSTVDPAAFPFGALGMSLTSSMATVLYCIPQFTAAVKYVAGV